MDCKIPLWNIENEVFVVGLNSTTKRRKIPVDFTVRTGNALDPALLIDYQGGKDIQDRLEYRVEGKPKSSLVSDSVPVQMLVLTPEGKLVVRSYQEDNANEERAARYKTWKDWIAEVEGGKRKPKQDEPLFDRFRGGGNNN